MEDFSFERGRGVVWVCDVAESSQHLNKDDSVDAIELFLPRLSWIARRIIDASGGDFIKWTGDGFLAWYPCELERHLPHVAYRTTWAAWHLTFMVNVTQLAVTSPRPFRIRHGLAYEPDALMTTLTSKGHTQLDILGRAVVLAFRLSGVPVAFPSIVATGDIVEAVRRKGRQPLHFRAWRPSSEERLKYFKGEMWGTKRIFVSSSRRQRPGQLSSALRKARAAVSEAEGRLRSKDDVLAIVLRFQQALQGGPAWAREVDALHTSFIKNGLLGSLKDLVNALDKAKGKDLSNKRLQDNSGQVNGG